MRLNSHKHQIDVHQPIRCTLLQSNESHFIEIEWQEWRVIKMRFETKSTSCLLFSNKAQKLFCRLIHKSIFTMSFYCKYSHNLIALKGLREGFTKFSGRPSNLFLRLRWWPSQQSIFIVCIHNDALIISKACSPKLATWVHEVKRALGWRNVNELCSNVFFPPRIHFLCPAIHWENALFAVGIWKKGEIIQNYANDVPNLG